MTLANNYNPTRQLANGVTTSFSFNYDMINSDYAAIYQEVDGVQTLVDSELYTIEFDDNGGNVVFKTAPSAGVYIVVGRNVPTDQETPYRTSSGFPAIGFIACYASYKLYGWGLYVGRLLEGGKLNPNLIQYRECELIDDLLYSCRITFKGKTVWLYEYPKLFGFCGVTLTGLIITFLWGLYFGSLPLMLSGLAMGLCYWLGGKLEKLKALGKSGWNWGEIIFGTYLGAWLALGVL